MIERTTSLNNENLDLKLFHGRCVNELTINVATSYIDQGPTIFQVRAPLSLTRNKVLDAAQGAGITSDARLEIQDSGLNLFRIKDSIVTLATNGDENSTEVKVYARYTDPKVASEVQKKADSKNLGKLGFAIMPPNITASKIFHAIEEDPSISEVVLFDASLGPKTKITSGKISGILENRGFKRIKQGKRGLATYGVSPERRSQAKARGGGTHWIIDKESKLIHTKANGRERITGHLHRDKVKVARAGFLDRIFGKKSDLDDEAKKTFLRKLSEEVNDRIQKGSDWASKQIYKEAFIRLGFSTRRSNKLATELFDCYTTSNK